jgi:CRISPR-associated protein Csy3
MAKETLITASVLAFERKLDVSDALFSAGKWDDREKSAAWQPVSVREKSVRGTISNRLKASEQDPAKLDAKIDAPNLQTVDVATLPNDADTLKIRFTLRVLGGVGSPSACNNSEYLQKLQATVKSYVDEYGFCDLAYRYATNLANGRFLWRNRMGAETIEVHVSHKQNGQNSVDLVFDALDFSLRNFDAPSNAASKVKSLATLIEGGLSGEGYVLLEVIAFARIGDGQEVFPSQELVLDKGSNKKGQKSKTLYTVKEIAAMHSQKIGNALRTIDNWYPDSSELGPIAVEPYGSVTSQGKAYRQPKQKQDFYNLLDSWVLKDRQPEEGNKHYVMATLIRGGVFGESGKE